MAYLLPADFKTHIYGEYLEEIVRADATITQEAIDAAIDLTKSYLSKYDLAALFGVGATPATVVSPMLKRHVKNIACWYLLTVSNSNIEMELFEKLYDTAISWLKDIQKGMANPDWPYADKTQITPPAEGNEISASYNPKRSHHF